MIVDFDSVWFQSYCKAILADTSESARNYIQSAADCIDGRLRDPNTPPEEREALYVALRYLSLIQETELPIAS